MKRRYLLSAGALLLAAGTANAQYVPATYQEPYCREFNKTVLVGGTMQPAYGRACYQPDGSWQIVSDDIPASQPVQYYPVQNQVVYVPQPTTVSSFSLNFSSYNNPYRTRYYNDYGHGWRDWNRKPGRGKHWDRGRDRHDRHDRQDGHGRGRR
jgi:hypothetical protein